MFARSTRIFNAIALSMGLLLLAACGGGSSDSPSTTTPPPPTPPVTTTQRIGGTVTGLGSGASAALSAASGNTVTVSANGAYTFPVALAQGSSYSVTLTQQPTTQQCSLSNASGTVGTSDVTNINVACVDLPTLGGTLSGLSSGASVSLLNGTDQLVLTADGAFTFAKRLHPGDTFSVSVSQQPTGELCTLANATGTIAQSSVTSVSVVCAVTVARQAVVSLYVGDMGGSGQADGTGTNARFRSPDGIVAEPGTGVAWVADTGNHAIRRIDANGAVTTFAGTPGVGGSVDGQGAAARFLSPSGIARDGAGNLYVTDSQMNVVRKITPDGTVTTLAGFAGLSGSADGKGTTARFKNPSGIAAMADGTLFVADTNNFTIRKITPDGTVTTYAGVVGTFGHDDTLTGGQPATFFGPSGVAVTSTGTVFVADTANHTIRAISPAGVVSTAAGQPQIVGYADGAANAALFDSPQHLSYSESDGALYIADSINDTVRRLVGGTVTTIAGQPLSGVPIDGDTNTARLVLPIGITIASSTTLYVTDNNFSTVRSVSLTGSVTTIAGQARQVGSVNGAGNAARFITPTAIAALAGQLDTLLVTDSSDHTVRGVKSGSVTTIAGNSGVRGSNYGSNPVLSSLLDSPGGVSGSARIADTGNNVIAHADPTTGLNLVSGAPPPASRGFADGNATAARFGAPSGLSDGPDFTYVADLVNHAVRAVSRVDGSVTTLAGDGTAGSNDGATAHFNHPKDVLYVSDGVLVADTDNHSIRKVLFSGGTITLAGKSGDPGAADGAAADARFKSPSALAADAAGNVYIADAGNFTIRRLTPAGEVTTIAGKVGIEGFTTGEVGVLSAVRGLAVGTDGALYATMYQGIVKVVLP